MMLYRETAKSTLQQKQDPRGQSTKSLGLSEGVRFIMKATMLRQMNSTVLLRASHSLT